jgi:hypothetical protein
LENARRWTANDLFAQMAKLLQRGPRPYSASGWADGISGATPIDLIEPGPRSIGNDWLGI